MEINIESIKFKQIHISTRMPFRYGITTMTHLPHLFVLVQANFSGRSQFGISSDHLPPKWFTKDPESDPQEDIAEMRLVIKNAGILAHQISSKNIFDFWFELYQRQTLWAETNNVPLLLAHFGTSLIERALIDAFCRYHGQPFHHILIRNDFGVDWGIIRSELSGLQPKDLLPGKPLETIELRHTVGLVDPLEPSDIDREKRLSDGLPQSLRECIRFYGLRHFKVKVNGEVDQDMKRMRTLASLFKDMQLDDFAFTLDGNEQFKHIDTFKEFWQCILEEPNLTEFFQKLMFVEQPFHRKVALSEQVGECLLNWKNAPPIIIDESDGALDSMPRALDLGYIGVSHKNCKSVFKGIINRATINHYNKKAGKAKYLMSGEDLSNIGPVANHQDLVVQASLGNHSVERNGHHYFKGLSVFDRNIQHSTMNAFPTLYTAEEKYVRLNIQGGKLVLKDLLNMPFGTDQTILTWIQT